MPNENRTGTLKVMQKLNPYEFGVEISVMREGVNNNKWDYRNVEQNYKTFLGQPILIAYVGRKIGDGHNMRETTDHHGNRVYTFTDGTSERIIGTLSEDENDFRIEERDGDKWIVAKGKIFAFYAREAVEKIVDTGSMDVSAETDVYESEDGENGVEIFTEWAGLGVTILGDDVPPAIPGARIKKLSTLKEDFDGLKLKAASLLKEDKPKDNKGVKRQMNKREMAEANKKFEGYTVIGGSDDGMNVVLMSNSDFSFHGYTFNEEDKGAVVTERIVALKADSAFQLGDVTIPVDTDEIVDGIGAKLLKANSDLEAEKSMTEKLNSQISDMLKKEHERRIDAAKLSVNAYLENVNASRCGNEKFAKELADKVCNEIDNGMYIDDECDGKWVGDRNAVCALKSLCMDAQAAQDADRAAKKANAYMMMGDVNKGHESEKTHSVADMMNFLNE